jgi:hypothetical protein
MVEWWNGGNNAACVPAKTQKIQETILQHYPHKKAAGLLQAGNRRGVRSSPLAFVASHTLPHGCRRPERRPSTGPPVRSATSLPTLSAPTLSARPLLAIEATNRLRSRRICVGPTLPRGCLPARTTPSTGPPVHSATSVPTLSAPTLSARPLLSQEGLRKCGGGANGWWHFFEPCPRRGHAVRW